jgi:hypothetical protein
MNFGRYLELALQCMSNLQAKLLLPIDRKPCTPQPVAQPLTRFFDPQKVSSPRKTTRRSIEYSRVYHESTTKTRTGNVKDDLVFSKHTKRVVSKKKSEAAKALIARPDNAFQLWRDAREAVRQDLNLGRVMCSGATEQGKVFYEATLVRFAQLKAELAAGQ